MTELRKGQVAQIAQINSETLRFYEKRKLIPQPMRTASGYRLYSEETLSRLVFIKNAKAAGFTLSQIKELFDIAEREDVSLDRINEAVDEKIMEIDDRISNLLEMKASLTEFKARGKLSLQCPHIHALLSHFKEQ